MTETRLMTAEELLALPDDDNRHELVRGVLTTMPPPGAEHGAIGAMVLIALGVFVEEHGLGRVYNGETGFRIEQDPDVVRAPDVAFVSAARLPAKQPAGYLPLAPDLVVEVMSPSDTRPRIEEKLREYFAAGTRLAWVFHPAQQTALVATPDGGRRELRIGAELDGGEAVPGFRLPLARVFR